MQKFFENVFLILLSIALLVFVIFLIEEAVSYSSKDYQYALIGALGSLIGGSLTLAGVWWTLRNQAKTDFINEFPKKARNLEEILIDIKSLSTKEFFNETVPINRQGVYQQWVAKMKTLAAEVDGNCYFIVGKLDDLYNDYLYERPNGLEFIPDFRDGLVVRTKEMMELEDKYINLLDEIIRELGEYNKELTDKFIRYKK